MHAAIIELADQNGLMKDYYNLRRILKKKIRHRGKSKQKTEKRGIFFATFQRFNIFANGGGSFFYYYMEPFLIVIYNRVMES